MRILPSQIGILLELVIIYPRGINHNPKKSPPTPQAWLDILLKRSMTASCPTIASEALATPIAELMAIALIIITIALTVPQTPTAQAAHSLISLNNL